jgi:hypothetical protein
LVFIVPALRPSVIFATLASATLLGTAALQAVGEVSPYVAVGYSAERRFAALSGGDYAAGDSLWSKDMVLRDCLEVGESLYAKVQPTARRAGFYASCLNQAQSMTREMPAYSRAWLAVAVAADGLGLSDQMADALHQSSLTAPHVHFLAERRVALAVRRWNGLDEQVQQALESDMRTLLDSSGGARALAVIYVDYPQHRERLTRIAEGAPADLQRRFLGEVDRRLRQVAS